MISPHLSIWVGDIFQEEADPERKTEKQGQDLNSALTMVAGSFQVSVAQRTLLGNRDREVCDLALP